MIASSERSEMIGMIATVQLGMFLEDGIVARLQDFSPDVESVRRNGMPCAFVALAAAVRSPVWHGFFDSGANGMQVVWQIACVQVCLNCHHAAPDVNADGGGNNRALRRDHAAHGCANAPVHIRHGRNPLEDEGQLGHVEELLARGVFQRNALDPGLDRDALLGFESLVGHDCNSEYHLPAGAMWWRETGK